MKKCYFCGAQAISFEHAPPKQVFKGFRCDRITVPSCEKHNNDRSSIDEAIIKSMIYSLSQVNSEKISPVIQKAIKIAMPKFDQVKKLARPGKLLNDADDITVKTAYIEDDAKIDEWIRNLTAALVYKILGYYDADNKYEKMTVVNATHYNSPESGIPTNEFLKQYEIKRLKINAFESLNWKSGWSSGNINYPKELYYFMFSFNDEMLWFKHHFYENYLMFSGFVPSDNTKKIIMKFA